mgnify:CR=1 FL=1
MVPEANEGGLSHGTMVRRRQEKAGTAHHAELGVLAADEGGRDDFGVRASHLVRRARAVCNTHSGGDNTHHSQQESDENS